MEPSDQVILGVDLGGSTTGIGVVDSHGSLEKFTSIPTEVLKGPEHLVKKIGEATRRLTDNCLMEIHLVGLGAPGPLDTAAGIVSDMPNFGWKNVPLRRMVQEELGITTFLDNDANAAAYGEWWVGAGIGAKVLICFTLGTGVGGGIVVDGEVFRGVKDSAAEFGHMVVQPDGRKCSCGKWGCLEAYASATAIAARARERAEEENDSLLSDLAGGELSRLTSEIVSQGALHGDQLAGEIMDETARYLAIGVSNVMNALNPDVVVMGGGVMEAGEMLLSPLRKYVRGLTFEVLERSASIVPAMLGREAGIVGAAGIAMTRGESP